MHGICQLLYHRDSLCCSSTQACPYIAAVYQSSALKQAAVVDYRMRHVDISGLT